MAQPGDSKGEYRGLYYRNDADLAAWLAKRPAEAALEPDLPIIDPHHHFWDVPQRGRYFLPGPAGRYRRRPQHRRDGVPRMPGDVSQARSGRDGTGRRSRVRQRHRGDECVGQLRSLPRRRGDHRPRRPHSRRARARCAGGADRRRRRALPRHPLRRVVGRQRRDQQVRLPRRAAAPGRATRPSAKASRSSAKLGLSFESWQYHPQLSDAIDLARAFPDTTIILNHVGGVLGVGPYSGRRDGNSAPAGARTSANWRNARTSTSSSAASA